MGNHEATGVSSELQRSSRSSLFINAYVKPYKFIFPVVAYLTVYHMDQSMIFTTNDPTFTRGAHYRSGFLEQSMILTTDDPTFTRGAHCRSGFLEQSMIFTTDDPTFTRGAHCRSGFLEQSMIFTTDDPTITRSAHNRSGFLVLKRLNFNHCIDKKSHVRQSVKRNYFSIPKQ